MSSIHEDAAHLGVKRPILQYRSYKEGDISVLALTEESETLWANYLRAITHAKIKLTSQNASV